MRSIRVRDFMATKYAKLAPEMSISSAVKKLLEYHQSAAPVVDEQNQLIGLLSEADCMRATLVEGYFNEGVALVKDLMSTEPESVSPEIELSSVTEIFLNSRRRMMPVVETGTLVGILLRKNILNAIVNVQHQ